MTRTAHGQAGAGNFAPSSVFFDEGRFGRLFPSLPPFSPDTQPIRDALAQLGAPGGPMDAKDDLSDPISLITNPAKSANNPDNPKIEAGFTFLGQFIDHDMTFDPTSSLSRAQDPESIRNFRIPALDLDSVYGSGPIASPHLYDGSVDSGQTKLLVEPIPGAEAVSIGGMPRFDLPRNSQRTALAGDPRNDENLIISQLLVAFLRFHNRVVDDVKAQLGSGHTVGEIFAQAQRVVRWHYQWMILHEYLPKSVGADMANDVIAHGPKFYKWRNDRFIPVEFSVAAFRFGHSQVRPSYRVNFGTSATDPTKQFFAMMFDASLPESDDPADMRGGKRAARRFIDWQPFFDFGDGRKRQNKKIDSTLSTALFTLLGQVPGTPTSLAARNLLRNLTMKVPSGQRVAKAMREPELAAADLDDLKDLHMHNRTPLWFYILREAQVASSGEHLGPVGGRIVAEVLYGLIKGDTQSYLRQDPDWVPTYGQSGSFTAADLLRAAGVVATLP